METLETQALLNTIHTVLIGGPITVFIFALMGPRSGVP